MNVTVIHDKESVIYNGEIYRKGDSFDVDERIGESLMERGYVAGEAGLLTGTLDEEQLREMSYPDLKRLAAQMGLDATGKKEDIIARICKVEVTAGDDENPNDGGNPNSNEGGNPGEDEAQGGDLPATSMPE